jgi:IS30 family transposase
MKFIQIPFVFMDGFVARREEEQAEELYKAGIPFSEIATKLNRTHEAIIQRAISKKWYVPSQAMRKKKPVVWKTVDQDFKVFQEAPSQILSPS